MQNTSERSYTESEANNNKLYSNLYHMMNEYNNLNLNEKEKYMNVLTGWYMREKDTLKLELDKLSRKN